jgi:hypothetical protein
MPIIRDGAMPSREKSMIIAEIVSQHAEEAAFLWLLRSNAVGAPHYSLKDLAKLDGRVEAHLDGLRVAGSAIFAEVKDGRPCLHSQSRGGQVAAGYRGSQGLFEIQCAVYGVA